MRLRRFGQVHIHHFQLRIAHWDPESIPENVILTELHKLSTKHVRYLVLHHLSLRQHTAGISTSPALSDLRLYACISAVMNISLPP
jgi:hypothetical protein